MKRNPASGSGGQNLRSPAVCECSETRGYGQSPGFNRQAAKGETEPVKENVLFEKTH